MAPVSQYLKHPLVHLSVERIRDRAYFRSLNAPNASSFENWLRAEEEELLALVETYFAEVVPVGETPFAFFDMYESVFSWKKDEQGCKRIGTASPRQCSICRKTQNDGASFRHIAHVLPQLTGSNRVTTYDECDICNHSAGEQYETDLGNLLLPARALEGARGQEGNVKLSFKHEGSFVRHTAGRLVVGAVENGKSVCVSTEANSMEIKVTRSRFRPRRVVLALAKIAWQTLPLERRAEFEGIRKQLNGECDWKEHRFYRVKMRGLRRVSLGVWVRRSAAPTELPPLVMMLSCAGTLLIWNCPDLLSGAYFRPVFPPFLRWWDRSVMPVGEFHKAGDDYVPTCQESFRFGFNRKQLVMVQSSIAVTLEFEHGDGTERIKTQLSTPSGENSEKSGVIEYDIGGGELIGRLLISETLANHEFAVSYRLDVAPRSNMPLEPTSRLLAALAEMKGFRVLDARSNEAITPWLGGEWGIDLPVMLDGLQTAERLAVLRDKLGVSIPFPSCMDDDTRRFLMILADGIMNGVVCEHTPNAVSHVTMPVGIARQLCDVHELVDLPGVHQTQWIIEGYSVDPGRVGMTLGELCINEPIENVKSKVAHLEDTDHVVVEVAYNFIRHEFCNFLPSGQVVCSVGETS